MQLSTTSAPLRVNAPARLDIQLDAESGPATYRFSFAAEPGVPDPLISARDGHVDLTMRSGTNYWLDVQFAREGRWELHFTRLSSSAEEESSAEAGRPEGAGTPPVEGGATSEPPVTDGIITLNVFPPAEPTIISLTPEKAPNTADTVLWDGIEAVTAGIRFNAFEDRVRIGQTDGRGLPAWFGVEAYRDLVRQAQEFVKSAINWPVEFKAASDQSYVPSLRERFVDDVKLDRHHHHDHLPLANIPLIELIWSYWMEEGMLVQSLNYILARFENRRIPGGEPLYRLDLNPLLPLRNVFWGFAEDERRRLTVRRRAAEYEYQYGLRMIGRAVPARSQIMESRSPFIEAFHNLLNAVHQFYKEHDDNTISADAFPLLASLREVHLLLAHGAHNQFADLAPTARAEMLAMQWILGREEMRLFLGGPAMVPYEESWMDRVDTMKGMQGWADASITHFFDLAVHGERVVLSVRHGRWNETGHTRDDAKNWALRFRESIQRYIHAYRAVTGVDLTMSADTTMPSTLLLRRLRRSAGA